jgi:hypothetical protein
MRPILRPTKTTSHPDRQIECKEAIAAAFHEAVGAEVFLDTSSEDLVVTIVNLARDYLDGSFEDTDALDGKDRPVQAAFRQITKAAEGEGWSRTEIGFAVISLALNYLSAVSETSGTANLGAEPPTAFLSAPTPAAWEELSSQIRSELVDRRDRQLFKGYRVQLFSAADNSPIEFFELAVNSRISRAVGVYFPASSELAKSKRRRPFTGIWLNAGDAVEAAQLLHDSLEARGHFG